MTPTRLEIFRVLEALSNRYPDMRFGQLVSNIANWAARIPDALWDVEDEEFLAAARQHLERRAQEIKEGPHTSVARIPDIPPPGENLDPCQPS